MTTYVVTKVTELDRVTPKEAMRGQNFSYSEEFSDEQYRLNGIAELDRSMRLLRRKDGVGEWEVINTSYVNRIDETESELIVETRNTVYFFEKREDQYDNQK